MYTTTTNISNLEVKEEHYPLSEKKPKKKPSSALKSNSKPFTTTSDQDLLVSDQIFSLDQLTSPSQYQNINSGLDHIMNTLRRDSMSPLKKDPLKRTLHFTQDTFFPQEQTTIGNHETLWRQVRPKGHHKKQWNSADWQRSTAGRAYAKPRTFKGSTFGSGRKGPIRREMAYDVERVPVNENRYQQREFQPTVVEPMRPRRDYAANIGTAHNPFVIIRNLPVKAQNLEESKQQERPKPMTSRVKGKEEGYVTEKDGLPEEVVLRIGQPPLYPLSAYQLFVKDKYAELRKTEPNLSHKEIVQKANNYWLYKLSPEDKEAYKHKHMENVRTFSEKLVEHKARKKEILEQYWRNVNSGKQQEEGKPEKVKFKTAYRLFKVDNVASVKEEHPDMTFKERANIIKEMWRNLSPHSKYLYMKRSRLDKQK